MKIGRVPASLARWRAFRLFSVVPLPKFNWFASKLNSIYTYTHTYIYVYMFGFRDFKGILAFRQISFNETLSIWSFNFFRFILSLFFLFLFLSFFFFFKSRAVIHRIWSHDVFRRIHTNYVKWEYSLAFDLEAWLRTITNRFVFFSNDRRSPATK